MCRRTLLLVSLALALSLTINVSADEEIIIPDAGFDDHAVSAGGYTYVGEGPYEGDADSDYPGPWQSAGGDAWIDNGYYAGEDLPALSGDNKLYGYEEEEDSVYQILDETFIAGATYTLSCYEGSGWDGYDDGWWLYFTGEDYNNNLAEASGNGPVGSWQQVSLIYTATAADAGNKIGIKLKGDPWVTFDDFTLTYKIPTIASDPSPAEGQTDSLRDSDLSWSPGISAVYHNIFVGESFEDVNTATVPTVSDLDVNSFDPGHLEFGKTYFWRVDEVEGSPSHTVNKGDVWSFEVEPRSIPIAGSDIMATASSSSSELSMPEKTLDGSGLDENGAHAVATETMWFTAMGDKAPWIQYEFDGVKQLDTMKIWNSNSQAEGFIGYGVMGVQIEYSKDGETWNLFEDVNELSRAPGVPTYDQYDEIALGDIAAKMIRLTIQSNFGDVMESYSLSEVQFSMIPAAARMPEPESEAMEIFPSTLLSWRAGRNVAQSTIYLSSDPNDLIEGLAPSVSSTTNRIDLSSFDVQLGETYYWRVDEVNDADIEPVWTGPVWSFSIAEALIVEDFESYDNDSPDRPFQAWLDGFGYSADEYFPAGYNGNGTGAGIGHDIWSVASPHYNGDIMETLIKRPDSRQSMPFYYNNTGGVSSLTTRTFAEPQDWTANGIQTLVLYFYGSEDNTGGPLFVKINNQKVTYPDDADLSQPLWHQWDIDLASLGTTLNAVTNISIGVEGAGSGMILVDDILLYGEGPAVSDLVIYGFEDLPDGDGAIDGVHAGIDFGTGDWWGGDNWYGLTKCGYFAADLVDTDVSFTLPTNAYLVSIAVSADAAYSYTISDGVNEDINRTSGTTPEVIVTDWTSGGNTITIRSGGGWNIVIDDITYSLSE